MLCKPHALPRAGIRRRHVLAPVVTDAADIRIEMRAAAYAPAEIRRREGDTLTLANHDAVQHQPFVPTTGWGVNVGDIKPGGTASIPLARPGQSSSKPHPAGIETIEQREPAADR